MIGQQDVEDGMANGEEVVLVKQHDPGEDPCLLIGGQVVFQGSQTEVQEMAQHVCKVIGAQCLRACRMPIMPCLSGSELTAEDLAKAKQAVSDFNSDDAEYWRLAIKQMKMKDVLPKLLAEINFLRSVLEDEASGSVREVRNVSFESGVQWFRERALKLLDMEKDRPFVSITRNSMKEALEKIGRVP